MSELISNGEVRTPIASAASPFDEAMDQIRQSLQGLRFGTVSIIVQDGVVIQLERTERRRLRKSDRS
jgi:hypothetical protein